MSKNEFICDCNMVHEEMVNDTLSKMPENDILDSLAYFFKIMGDTTRCKLLFALLQNEMCVCDLAQILNMTQSAISHQLRVLKQMDLVRNRRDGKTVFYSLADDHIKFILNQGMEHINE